MLQSQVESLLSLAGIKYKQMYRLENGYWPDDLKYHQIRKANPWWLVLTSFGPVVIGWRKRVIQIDWKDSDIRGIVTTDDVTKDETMVHAWSIPMALNYLTNLQKLTRGSDTWAA